MSAINPTYSSDNNINALLEESPYWNYLTPSQGNVIYYSFANSYDHSWSVTNVTLFNDVQKAAARQALDIATMVTGIRFVETTSAASAEIRFYSADIMDDSTTGLTSWYSSYSYDWQTDSYLYSGDLEIFLDVVHFAANRSPTVGTEGFETLLHELGHALALKHPFEGTYQLPDALDNMNHTIMSYTSGTGYQSFFKSLDLAALNWLYGGDGLRGLTGVNSSVGPLEGQFNDVVGSLTGDVLYGTSGVDRFFGLAGNDDISGSTGIDTAVFAGKQSEYTLGSAFFGSQLTVASGREGTDVLRNVERVHFADHWLAFDLDPGENGASALEFVGTLAFPNLDYVPLQEVVMAFLDDGNDLRDLFKIVLDDGTVESLAGSGSDLDLVRLAYRNVVGTEAPAANAEALAELLPERGGSMSQLDFLTAVAQLPLNDQHVDLIGYAASGLLYHIA